MKNFRKKKFKKATIDYERFCINVSSRLKMEASSNYYEKLGIGLNCANQTCNHKVKDQVLELYDKIDINKESIWEILRAGLENHEKRILKRCILYLEENFNVKIIANGFSKVNIISNTTKSSLQDLHFNLLIPLFKIYEKGFGSKTEEHRLELSIDSDADPIYIREFLNKYQKQIKKLYFESFDGFDEQLIKGMFSKLDNLDSLNLRLEWSDDEDILFNLKHLKLLKNLDVENNNVEIIRMYSFPSLLNLNLHHLGNGNQLNIWKNPHLKKIRIWSSPELRQIDITECPNIREIEISNCPNLVHINLEDYPLLKYLKIIRCPKIKIPPEAKNEKIILIR